MASVSFYKFGLGMVHVSNPEKIPPAIKEKLIDSPELILVSLQNKLVVSRPPNIAQVRFSFDEIWSIVLKDYLTAMNGPPDA